MIADVAWTAVNLVWLVVNVLALLSARALNRRAAETFEKTVRVADEAQAMLDPARDRIAALERAMRARGAP